MSNECKAKGCDYSDGCLTRTVMMGILFVLLSKGCDMEKKLKEIEKRLPQINVTAKEKP